MATKIIGTGGDYTTITAWEAALPAATSEPEIGILLGEVFAEAVTFSGITTSVANYVELRAGAGFEHHGLSYLNPANEFNARAVVDGGSAASTTITITSVNHLRLIDFEITGAGGSTSAIRHGINVAGSYAADADVRLVRLLINGGSQANAQNDGIRITAASAQGSAVRCIVYRMGGSGIRVLGINGGITYKFINDTCHNNNQSASATGRNIRADGANATFINCVAADANGGTDYTPAMPAPTTIENCASGDTSASGPGAVDNIVDTANFINVGPALNAVDLRLLPTAPIRELGAVNGTVNANIGIQGNAVQGTWDIGADEFPDAIVQPLRPARFRHFFATSLRRRIFGG